MRTIVLLFWGLVAVGLITVGLANRGIVTLRVLPEALSGLAGVSPDVDLPLFLVVLGGFALGLLVGFVWEWLREHGERAEARATQRELQRLRGEVARLSEAARLPARPAPATGTAVGAPSAAAGAREDLIAAVDAPVLRG